MAGGEECASASEVRSVQGVVVVLVSQCVWVGHVL